MKTIPNLKLKRPTCEKWKMNLGTICANTQKKMKRLETPRKVTEPAYYKKHNKTPRRHPRDS